MRANTSAAMFEERLRALGPQFDPQVLGATKELYKPYLDVAEAAQERRDVSYGPHERHRLDIYRPAGAARAVVVFVHGGGFVAGDKDGDGVFYRNVGRWLARNGFVGVLMNYRLAGSHPWPAGARDVGSVLEWVGANGPQLGGASGAPVVLWGQSAGASHVATWLFDANVRQAVLTQLAGVLLMSGFYRPEAPLPAGPRAYFGEDEAYYDQRSPVTHVTALATPLCLAVAELDPAWIAQQTYSMARAVTIANGHSPHFYFFRGHNHVSTVQSLGSPHEESGAEVLRFLSQVTGSP